MDGMRLAAAPDKFRGTASAAAAADALIAAAATAGWAGEAIPLADGGEGTLDVLGGPNRESWVSGPLGDPVLAPWRLVNRTAVIEMARCSGLALVGGPEGNDPIAASTAGTGELIGLAVEAGARRVIVTLGGSATTDGGFGALEALQPLGRLRGIELLVACDVRTRFTDAAEGFGAQKGATAAQRKLLTRRLERLVQVYRDRHGVDVGELPRAGAAGGLAGGLAAVGAELVGGFDLVAEEVGLADRLQGADLVVTGEGSLDEHSLDGKVVGGVVGVAARLGIPVLVVCGRREPGFDPGVPTVALVERCGEDRSWHDTLACLREVTAEELRRFKAGDA